jgi:hypothetical protein
MVRVQLLASFPVTVVVSLGHYSPDANVVRRYSAVVEVVAAVLDFVKLARIGAPLV